MEPLMGHVASPLVELPSPARLELDPPFVEQWRLDKVEQIVSPTPQPFPARQPGAWRRQLLVRGGFVGLYLVVLAWFGLVDVYHQHFFTAGPLYLGYTLARVLFLAYLGWSQFFVGQQLLRFWQRRGALVQLRLLEEFLLCFYAGAALLAGFTFLLGFLNLYYYWFFVCGSAGLVALSAASFGRSVGIWWSAARTTLTREPHRLRRYAHWLVLGCVVLLASILLVVKGLYPGGGGDYYTHYFPYFRHVLLSHGLWPNDVWYHFYISKGATITLSCMLLTDPQAPELVTYLYFLVATLCVYALLRRCANNPIVPCLGMATCLGAFIWTQTGIRHPLYSTEWGQFQKHHEFTGSLLLSVVWLAAVCGNCVGPSRKAWMTFMALSAGHCVLFAPPMYPLVFAALGLVLAMAWWRRAWGVCCSAVAGLACASLVLGGLLTLNYLCTGLAEVTPPRLFWKYADQERFSRWVSPYMMVLLLEGSSPSMGDVQVVNQQQLGLSRLAYLRLLARTHTIRYFFPDVQQTVPVLVLLVLLGIGVQWLRGRRLGLELWRVAVPVLGMFVSALVLSQLVTQPVSIYRCFSFLVFLVVLVALGLWVIVFRLLPQRKLVWLTSYALPALLTCLVTFQSVWAMPAREWKESIRFARGRRVSLADAYRTRYVDSDVPVAIRKVIGHEPRVYTFNHRHFAMAPGCELESFVSFGLHQDLHEVLFESPERARAALQKQGLNYFLIDLNCSGATGLDVLQFAPLFQPGNLEKHFQVCWQRDNVVLLTWPGPNTTPLTADLMRSYGREEFLDRFHMRSLYNNVRAIYEMNRGKPYPVYRDPSLPAAQGWQ